MFYTIYKITNLIDGKIYIGKHQTLDLNDDYMGSGKLLHSAKQKHGLENFKKEILHVFESEDEMNAKEAELVNEEFCAREDTYNLCPGGHGGWGYINQNGLNFTENHRKGILNWLKNFHENATPEYYRSLSEKGRPKALKAIKEKCPNGTFYGKTHTEKWKKTHSEFMKVKHAGENNPQFGKMWITNGNINKTIIKTDIIPDGWYKGRVLKK